MEFTEVEPEVWETGPLEVVPTWVSLNPIRLVDLAGALPDPDLAEDQRQVYQDAYDRILGHVDGLGVSGDPDFVVAG